MSDLVKYSEQTFESIKHVNEYGEEYWLARELQLVLEYAQWRRFSDAIERAKLACKNSGFAVEDHFADIGKMVDIGSGAERQIDDVMLSRYACYLIVMNGDPRKEVISIGQSYFAVKTRQQELIDNYEQMAAMELMMPPTMREQQTIGGFFQQLDHLITLHQRELAEVGKYKKALMQLLLTGLVRVNA